MFSFCFFLNQWFFYITQQYIPKFLTCIIEPALNGSRWDIQLIRKLMRPGLPGERPPGKRGRDTKWTSELHHQLILDVLELTGGEEKKISTSAACLILAKREPWLSLVETLSTKRDPADVLRERYVRLYMAAFDIYEDVKTGELEVKIREKNKKHGGKYQ